MNKSSGSNQKRKCDWISSSFGNDSTADLQVSHKRKQLKTQSTIPLDNGEDIVPWLDKYGPTYEIDLAVNKKKVSEVKQWLVTHFQKDAISKAGILLLTGPAGCGKTAALQVLAKELSFKLKEWINPVGQDYKEKSFDKWRDFLSSQDSQSQQFNDFLLRANRYNALCMMNQEEEDVDKKHVVLIEDFPNFILHDPTKLHSLLRVYKRNGRSPLVFILSDSQDTENTVHKILPKMIQNEFDIYNISFNAVTTQSLKKTMLNIVATEAETNASIIIPSKDTYEMLAASSNGDIRSCVNLLQFFCTNSYQEATKPRTKTRNSTKSKSRKTAKQSMKKTNDMVAYIGGRDASLFLFRSLGKILYSKRDSLKKEERFSLLPPHMKNLTRNPLQICPEDVFQRTHITSDTFMLYLHQNYPEFYKDIDDISNASLYISDADVMSGDWSSRNAMSNYSSSVCIRGIMFSNTSTHSSTGAVSGGWRPLHKPQWFESFKTRNSRRRIMNDYFQDIRFSTKALCIEIIPYMGRMNTPLKLPGHRSFVNEVSNFQIGRIQSRLLQTINDDVMHDITGVESYEPQMFKSQRNNDGILDNLMAEDDVIEEFDDEG